MKPVPAVLGTASHAAWTPYCLEHQQALEKQRRLRTPTL
jgi:hypothetical protein